MYIYIGIEDIAANAFIEASKNSCTRELSFNTLNNYSNRILKILNSESQQATLKISYEETQKLFIEYSDFFVENVNSKDFFVSNVSSISENLEAKNDFENLVAKGIQAIKNNQFQKVVDATQEK